MHAFLDFLFAELLGADTAVNEPSQVALLYLRFPPFRHDLFSALSFRFSWDVFFWGIRDFDGAVVRIFTLSTFSAGPSIFIVIFPVVAAHFELVRDWPSVAIPIGLAALAPVLSAASCSSVGVG